MNSPNLLDFPNEILLHILIDMDTRCLLHLAVVCRQLNHLAISQVLYKAGVQDTLVISRQTIADGVVRALSIEMPLRGFDGISCKVTGGLVLQEASHLMQRVTEVSQCDISCTQTSERQPSAKDWIDFLESLSKPHCMALSLYDPRYSQTLSSRENLPTLTPMRYLERITITETPLLNEPYFIQWFIDSMNASPLRKLNLRYGFGHLLQNLHLTYLQELRISVTDCNVWWKLTFEELSDFLARHSHITSLHIVRAFTRTLPCALPSLLLKNLTKLTISAAYFPSLIPSSDQTSSFRFSLDLIPCSDHLMSDCTCMVDTFTRIAETSIGKLRLNLASEKEAVWMQTQIVNSETLTPLISVTSLKIELASNRQAKAILAQFLGCRFPQLTQCCVSFWPSKDTLPHCSGFLGVEVILFARDLAASCPLLEYLQINHDRRHIIDWMEADVGSWDERKEQENFKLMEQSSGTKKSGDDD